MHAAIDDRVRILLESGHDPLAQDGPNVIRNLSGDPKRISPIYVYDREGTRLFERQCGTPEYYLRRAETELLRRHAAQIVSLCDFPPIVELGAGTAEKTRLLLAEYAHRASRCEYFPIDIDIDTLVDAARLLTSAFPNLQVHCMGATYADALEALPPGSRNRLFLFLGSSLGNMEHIEIDALLSTLFHRSAPGDHLVLGVDLDKDPAVIDRAYNDDAGWGPRSTLNMLTHLNRRYAGDFQVPQFAYRSKYNAPLRKNEVRLESLIDQRVTLRNLNLEVVFRRFERIEAEVMYKFDPDELISILSRNGYSPVRRWIDPRYHYGLFLAHRDGARPRPDMRTRT